jgi:hypothetical protein
MEIITLIFFIELLMVRKGGEPCSLYRMDLIKFKVLLIYWHMLQLFIKTCLAHNKCPTLG